MSEPTSDDVVEHPLPGGAIHLLPADDVVRQDYGTSSHISLCGELVGISELPPALCSLDCEDEHRYCGACVREALRWNAELGHAPASTLSTERIITQLHQFAALDGGW
ncbi:MAG: hypothetical protein ACRDSH_20080 [Pseudonocardiaceae bacterium]